MFNVQEFPAQESQFKYRKFRHIGKIADGKKKKKKSNDWFVKHFLSKFEHESPKRKV